MSDTISKEPLNNNTSSNNGTAKMISAKDRDVERGDLGGRGGKSDQTSEEGSEALPSATICSRSGSSRGWRAVAPTLRHIALVMIIFGILSGLVALVWIYMGPIFVLQLFIVVVIAYFVSGGRLRWFYVAAKTAPRDVKALLKFAQLMWWMRCNEKKNQSVADIFRQNVAKHPNKPCLICEDREWTFQEIEDLSNKVATIFKTHGYRKGDAVSLLMENRPEFVAIWLGLSKLGVIIPLINTNLRKSSLLHSVNISKCQALIFSAELAEAVKDIAPSLDAKLALYRFGGDAGANASGLKEKDLSALLADVPSVPPVVQEKGNYKDKLMYIYTSGTTGLPKAAVITNYKFMFIAGGIHFLAGFKRSDRFYTPLPLYHTAGGIMSIGQTLLHGGTTIIRKKFSASAYFDDCRKYNCTVAQYIGEMCRYILAVPPKPEDSQHNVKTIFGNGLRPQIWKEFVTRFKIPNIKEFYGATEGNANIVNTDNTVGAIGFVSRIVPAVYPISIIRVDAEGEPIRNAKGLCIPCEPDEPGVFIGKIIPNNPHRAFLGYVDEKASERKIVSDVFVKGDSAFLSGDIVVADELGYLYFKDRTGDTFRWKGENVSTSEVEAIVSNLVNYRDCIVYGVEVRGAEGRAGMVAIFDENGSLDLNQLAQSIREHVPAYARPQFVRILTKIDLTGTFKLKKKELQEDGYDPNKVRDKLYYLDQKSGYLPLTTEAYDQIHQGKIRF
ncbi:long-chain fatty acid transport protein 4 [Fopius arisanus]|uniref:long-chain-fatty-acid--CoA ligase n=1 Tax=Fopius arisanus TaxID=64838 RepID=A0A0C9RBI1_9HYME|nr:PREDICTED: long-chain fatty acid transport protein 4 [Fopius arisanus]